MRIASISSRRQISLSKDELEALGIPIYGKLLKKVESGRLILTPIKTSVVAETAGFLKNHIPLSKRGISFKKIRRKTQEIVAAELALEGT